MTTIKSVLTKVPPERLYLGSMLLLFGSYYLYNQISAWIIGSYLEGTDTQLFKALILTGGIVCKLTWSAVLLVSLYALMERKEPRYTSTIINYFVRCSLIMWAAVLLFSVIRPELLITKLTDESFLFIAPYLWKYVLTVFLFTISNVISYYFVLLKEYTPILFFLIISLFQISMLFFFHNGLSIVVHVQVMSMITLFVLQVLYFGCSTTNKILT